MKETLLLALVGMVMIGACVGAVGDDGSDESEVEENGESVAEAADEEKQENDSDDAGSNDQQHESGEATTGNDESNEPSEPVDKPDDSADDSTDEPSDDDQQANEQAAGPIALETTLVDMGLDVRTVEERGDTLHVEYVGYDSSREAISRDIGAVAGAYAGITSSGYESDRMEVTLRGPDGSVVGTYHVESEWADDYGNGRMSDQEYMQLVLDTIEVND